MSATDPFFDKLRFILVRFCVAIALVPVLWTVIWVICLDWGFGIADFDSICWTTDQAWQGSNTSAMLVFRLSGALSLTLTLLICAVSALWWTSKPASYRRGTRLVED